MRDLVQFQKEQQIQWNYIQEREKQYIDANHSFENVLKFLEEDGNQKLLIGESGVGKSMIISRVAMHYRNQNQQVLPILCGSSEKVTTPTGVCRYIAKNLCGLLELEEHDIDSLTGEELAGELQYLYDEYEKSELQPLRILVDGVDQLFFDYSLSNLAFHLPGEISKIKLLVSGTDEFSNIEFMPVFRLQPLNNIAKEQLVLSYMKYHHKELNPSVIAEICRHSETGNPLYLRFLLERILMLDREDFEQICVGSKLSLPDYQKKLIQDCPKDFESICSFLFIEAGKQLAISDVLTVAEYIALSRFGMRQEELFRLVSSENSANTFNQLMLQQLLQYLSFVFILRDDGRIDFAHKNIRNAILDTCGDQKRKHQNIVNCLAKLDETDNFRVQEIMYHTICADDKEFMIQYINRYEDQSQLIRPAAERIAERCLFDQGKWLCSVESCLYAENSFAFFDFLEFEWLEQFDTTQETLHIQYQVLNHFLHLAKKLKDEENAAFLSEKAGNVCMHLGDEASYVRAKELYLDYLGYCERVYLNSEDLQDKRNLSVAYEKMADYYYMQGNTKNFKLALNYYEKTTAISEELYQCKSDYGHLKDLFTSYQKMGDVWLELKEEGYEDKAIEYYFKGYEACCELVMQYDSSETREYKAYMMSKLGESLCEKGEHASSEELQQAVDLLQRAIDMQRKLLAINYHSWNLKQLAYSYGRLGNVFATLNSLDDALLCYQEYRTLCEQVYELEETLDSLREVSVSIHLLGDVCYEIHTKESIEDSLSYYLEDYEIAKEIVKTQPVAINYEDAILSVSNIVALYQENPCVKNLQKAVYYQKEKNQLYKELCELYPEDENYRKDYQKSMEWAED